MNIALYDSILNDLPVGDVCRGNQDPGRLISQLWYRLYHVIMQIRADCIIAGEEWASEEYYFKVLNDVFWRVVKPGYLDDEQCVIDDIDVLMESLDDLSPIGHYFGGHPDDPWRLGVWPEYWRDE